MVSGPVNAVVTTGIYCRDGCPASPLPGNVRTYPVDVGAEAAGFRPCRRCHPERRPPPAAWDAPDIVARALDEVCAGALDRSGEAQPARTCGVSARHLRRLFVAHVGAPPTQVAVSRRAHFARRLLDETDLPIAQIAFAAGFGSVRTMNVTIQRRFRSIRLAFTQTTGGPPGWTPAEAALKALGVGRARLHTAAQRWGSALPVPLLGLTLVNPDYHAISPEEWRALGVAAPAPLPDRFDEVAAWARAAAATT